MVPDAHQVADPFHLVDLANSRVDEVRRRVQHAKGYRSIIVNGEETFSDGECTGATPGRLLRHGRG